MSHTLRALLHLCASVPKTLPLSCLYASLLLTACGNGSDLVSMDRELVTSAHQAIATGTGFGSLIRLDGEGPGIRFGEYMAGVGDVNGDGFDDLAVGAAYWEPPGNTSAFGEYGRVYIYYGSATGVSPSRYQTISGSVTEERLAKVTAAGDVNGDGYADVLISGALNYTGETGLYLYLGGPSGLRTNAAWHVPFDTLRPESYGNIGDLDGDGRSEVLVAVAEYTTKFEYRLYVYGGTADGLTADPIWMYRSTVVMGATESGAGVGDFNGDGYNDIVVGYAWCGTVSPDLNLAAFWGNGTSLSETPDWGVIDTDCSFIGREIENAGDIDGDGYSDLVTSSHSFARIGFDGFAKVFRGGKSPATTAAWSKGFPENNSGWIDAAGLGDVLGDGYCDVAIGLDYFFDPPNGKEPYNDGFPPIGQGRVFSGSSSGLPNTQSWSAYDETFNNNDFAGTVVGAGDLNGDGFPDIALADYFIGIDYDHRRTGFVYVYYGTPGPEPSGRILWDLRSSDVGQITKLADGTRLQSSKAFDIAGVGLGTAGRTRVKLEVEIKPVSTAFDGKKLRQSEAWVDTGTTGAPVVLHVDGLTSNTAYTYRARLVYHPSSPKLTRHTRWFAGSRVVTACDGTEPDLEGDGICDDVDLDDDGDGVADTADCKPRDKNVYPGATEIPNDGIDEDCSGADSVHCYVDGDGDGYGGAALTTAEGSCTAKGLSNKSGDCNDADSRIFPGAPEVAKNQIDEDCDGRDGVVCFVDNDGDGFGATQTLTPEDQCPSQGLTPSNGDCNDSANSVFPGATETANDGIDQDCSGKDTVTCFVDKDGDGFGVSSPVPREGTCGGSGYAAKASDCDDSNASVSPGAHEVAGNGIDDDCDGQDLRVRDIADAGTARDSGVSDAGNTAVTGGATSTSTSAPLGDSNARDASSMALDAQANADGGCGCRISRGVRNPRQFSLIAISCGLFLRLRRRTHRNLECVERNR